MQNLMSSSIDWKAGLSGVGATVAVAYGIELAGIGVLPIPYATTAANIAAPMGAGVLAGLFLQNSYMSPEMTAAVASAGSAAAIFGLDDMKTPLALGAAGGVSYWLGLKIRGMMS